MMDYMLKSMRRIRKEDSGFTLIELLIVILILGILAGIAIFASGPFRQTAADACATANQRIQIVADAAVDAGVSEAGMFEQPAGDCAGGNPGGGGGGGTPVTASLVRAANSGAALVNAPASTFASAPAEGNLLVAVSGHRSNVSAADPGTVALSGSGWQAHPIVHVMVDGTNDRRAIAVWTKFAGVGEASSITADWSGTIPAGLVVYEFSTNATGVSHAGVPGTAPQAASLDLGGSGNIIAGLITRDGGTVAWSGGMAGAAAFTPGNIGLFLGEGDGPATATFDANRYASGFRLTLSN